MKIKTADLIGPALDWAVATIEGYGGLRRNPHAFDQSLIMYRVDGQCVLFSSLKYSTDWSQGGPTIEREEIGLRRNAPCSRGREWEASPSITAKGAGGKWGYGPTSLIAAMRCFVASRLGDEVDIPEELLK